MSTPHLEVFALRLKPGCEEAYKERHTAIWPELTRAFAAHGVLQYEIHLQRETGLLVAVRLRATDDDLAPLMADPVMRRWREHMADVLVQADGGGSPMREALALMYRFQPPDGGD